MLHADAVYKNYLSVSWLEGLLFCWIFYSILVMMMMMTINSNVFFFASLEHISCFFCLKFIKSRKRFVDKCKFQSGRGRVEASKGVVSFHADLLLCCFFYELNTRSAPFWLAAWFDILDGRVQNGEKWRKKHSRLRVFFFFISLPVCWYFLSFSWCVFVSRRFLFLTSVPSSAAQTHTTPSI